MQIMNMLFDGVVKMVIWKLPNGWLNLGTAKKFYTH